MKKIVAGLAAVLVCGALSFGTAEASESSAADLGTIENAQELRGHGFRPPPPPPPPPPGRPPRNEFDPPRHWYDPPPPPRHIPPPPPPRGHRPPPRW